jgi:hypothetical protein
MKNWSIMDQKRLIVNKSIINKYILIKYLKIYYNFDLSLYLLNNIIFNKSIQILSFIIVKKIKLVYYR